MKPTKQIAIKLLKTVDAGLCSGVGNPKPGEMCVEAAVCFAFGLPHGDQPPCVGSAVRSFKIALNDSSWSSSAARAKGMRRLALAQLGSDALDQQQFSELLALRIIQRMCPKLFRELGKLAKNSTDAEAMEQAAADCETATDLKSALDKLVCARARALSLDLARASALSLDLARASALSLDLARDLARDLALDLARDPARDRDESLMLIAEIACDVLIEMKSPGCKWLPICDLDTPARKG